MSGGSGFNLTNDLGGSIRVDFSTRDARMELLASESVTSGGLLRRQVAGSRVVITEKNIRLTEAAYTALMSFITNPLSNYRYYESDERPPFIPVDIWPLSVMIGNPTKVYQAYGGGVDGIIYVVDLEIRSVSLIT